MVKLKPGAEVGSNHRADPLSTQWRRPRKAARPILLSDLTACCYHELSRLLRHDEAIGHERIDFRLPDEPARK